jgi:hypothetical protein
MRTNITVRDDEIHMAQRGTTTRCAIAAAIMDQVPQARYIKVDEHTISWLDTDRRERFVYRTPPTAVGFLRRWDRGEDVTPIRFALTDAALIERRTPKEATPRTRVKRDPNPVIKKPGSRMTRHPSDECGVLTNA